MCFSLMVLLRRRFILFERCSSPLSVGSNSYPVIFFSVNHCLFLETLSDPVARDTTPPTFCPAPDPAAAAPSVGSRIFPSLGSCGCRRAEGVSEGKAVSGQEFGLKR